MIGFLSYIVGALGMAGAIYFLLRPRTVSPPRREAMSAADSLLWSDEGLSIAERILDSSDYLWLRDEVQFPDLAKLLLQERKRLALAWLRSVRGAFRDVVRTPEALPAPEFARASKSDWAQTLLTLRFNLLLLYATLVVHAFGPYHRMIPSLRWLNVITHNETVGDRYSMAGRANG